MLPKGKKPADVFAQNTKKGGTEEVFGVGNSKKRKEKERKKKKKKRKRKKEKKARSAKGIGPEESVKERRKRCD